MCVRRISIYPFISLCVCGVSVSVRQRFNRSDAGPTTPHRNVFNLNLNLWCLFYDRHRIETERRLTMGAGGQRHLWYWNKCSCSKFEHYKCLVSKKNPESSIEDAKAVILFSFSLQMQTLDEDCKIGKGIHFYTHQHKRVNIRGAQTVLLNRVCDFVSSRIIELCAYVVRCGVVHMCAGCVCVCTHTVQFSFVWNCKIKKKRKPERGIFLRMIFLFDTERCVLIKN